VSIEKFILSKFLICFNKKFFYNRKNELFIMIKIPKEFIQEEKNPQILFENYHNILLKTGFYDIFEKKDTDKTTLIVYHDSGLLVKIDSFKERLNSKQLYYNALIDYDKNFSDIYNFFYNNKNDSGSYSSYGDGRNVRLGVNSNPLNIINEKLNNLILLENWLNPNLIFPKEIYCLNDQLNAGIQYENFLNNLSPQIRKIFENKIVAGHLINEDSYYEKENLYEKKENAFWSDFIESHHQLKDISSPNINSKNFYEKAKNLLFYGEMFKLDDIICDEGINVFHLLSHIDNRELFNQLFDSIKNNSHQANLKLLNSFTENGMSPILHALKMFNRPLKKQTKENIETFLNWSFKTYKNDLILFNEKTSLINILFDNKYNVSLLSELILNNNINLKIPFHEVNRQNNQITNTFEFSLDKIKEVFQSTFSKSEIDFFENLLEKQQLEKNVNNHIEKSKGKIKI
jgi:hypothetical protein